jgi:hypothetical protein
MYEDLLVIKLKPFQVLDCFISQSDRVLIQKACRSDCGESHAIYCGPNQVTISIGSQGMTSRQS